MTFATDNLQAGKLIGQWAKATLGDKVKTAKVGFLDLTPSQPSVDVLRDQGFMIGFGIDPKDPNKIGDEDDKRIVAMTSPTVTKKAAAPPWKTFSPEGSGHQRDPHDQRAGCCRRLPALKAVGKEKDVLIVSVDGGCPGVKAVQDGQIGATSQQYPLLMASKGIEAIAAFAKDGTKPKATDGKNFFDTGVNLVTDKRPRTFLRSASRTVWRSAGADALPLTATRRNEGKGGSGALFCKAIPSPALWRSWFRNCNKNRSSNSSRSVSR